MLITSKIKHLFDYAVMEKPPARGGFLLSC